MSLIIKKEDFISDNAKRFTLRMDSTLFNAISVIAKQNRRSVAKEMECAIDQYVNQYIEEHDNSDNPGE